MDTYGVDLMGRRRRRRFHGVIFCGKRFASTFVRHRLASVVKLKVLVNAVPSMVPETTAVYVVL